jgi:hypothetical protein
MRPAVRNTRLEIAASRQRRTVLCILPIRRCESTYIGIYADLLRGGRALQEVQPVCLIGHNLAGIDKFQVDELLG